MITTVRLSNWRVYGEMELQLEAGTTFLIGMNGVGKSSLVEAVGWVLDAETKPNSEFIRKGERDAFVEVTLRVEDAVICIRRSLTLGKRKEPLKTPKSEYAASIDGIETTGAEVFARLEAAWGADVGFICRTAFLDMQLAPAPGDTELRAHLCRAYGLENLEQNVQTFELAIRAADKDARKEQAATGDVRQMIEQLRAELAREEAALLSTGPLADDLERSLKLATETLQGAENAQKAVEDLSNWAGQWQEIAQAAAEFVAEPPAGTDLRELLGASLTAAARQRDETRYADARLRERLATLEEALAALDASEQECPVCRRPLDATSRSHAHEAQAEDRSRISNELDGIDIEGPSTVVARLQTLLRDAERLGASPVAEIDTMPDVETAEVAVDNLAEQRDSLLVERGASKGRIDSLKQQVGVLERQVEEASAARAAYRRLGALTAARDALRSTVTEVLQEQMDPIGRQISAMWDQVFPDRPGLTVDPDGAIAREVEGGRLEFSSFSTGEKTVARLLVKLATLVTTTQVPFCWVDEPLEHLDEKSRLFVARMLAQFGKSEILTQVFVTTYQQSIAVMVGQSRDGPRVEYLGTSQVSS